MPKITRESLRELLSSSVCEISFIKRTDNTTRTMLCTLDESLLNSVNGRTTLNYKPASQAAKFNPAAKNLLCVWDVFMQDWRFVSMDSCSIINSIPRDEFWEYFNTNIYTMTTEQKNQFMGK